MPDNDKEKRDRIWKEQETIRQEQFWFTATTATIIGVMTGLIKSPNWWIASITLLVFLGLTGLTVYLLVQRFWEFHKRDPSKTQFKNWTDAFYHVFHELSGSLYCVIVVIVVWAGSTLIVLSSVLSASSPTTIEIKQGTRITIVP